MGSDLNFSAVLEKHHDVPFLAVRIVDTFGAIFLSDSLTDDSPHTPKGYIWVAKFPFRPPNVLIAKEDIYRKEVGSRKLGTLHLDHGTLFLS